MKAGRKLAIKTREELSNKIREYFDSCQIEGKPKTLSGLALALGISRQTLHTYGLRDEFGDIVASARNEVECYLEENLLMGNIVPTGAIFSLKNNFGWRDKIETENTNINTNKNYDLSKLSTEEIKELLKDE